MNIPFFSINRSEYKNNKTYIPLRANRITVRCSLPLSRFRLSDHRKMGPSVRFPFGCRKDCFRRQRRAGTNQSVCSAQDHHLRTYIISPDLSGDLLKPRSLCKQRRAGLCGKKGGRGEAGEREKRAEGGRAHSLCEIKHSCRKRTKSILFRSVWFNNIRIQ